MQQIEAQAVAASSRVAAALLGVGLAVSPLPARAAPAAAATPAAVVAPAPPAIAPLVTPERRSYRLALAATYALAPFAALGLGDTLSRGGAGDGAVALSVGVIFFTPAVIHIVHDKAGHGALSFLALAGLTGAGTLVGAIVGGGIGQAGCDPEQDSDGCDFAAFPGVVIGAFVGGVLSYSAYAVYDVVTDGEVVLRRTSADRAVQLWVRPIPGAALAAAPPVHEGATSPSGLELDGLQLGVTAPW